MKTIRLIAPVFLLTGCASMIDPSGAIVDMRGVDWDQYQVDLVACERYVEEVPLGRHVASGAVGGAVVVAVAGVASGGDSDDAEKAAGVGAVVGGTVAGVDAIREKRRVVRECLKNRGYTVLN